MKLQTRIQIGFLLWIVLVVFSCLFIAAFECHGLKTCHQCGSHQPYTEKSYWVLGLDWDEESPGAFQPSVLCRDFPDYACEHGWDSVELDCKAIWPNPLLLRPQFYREGQRANALASQYNRDAVFRSELNALLGKGVVARTHWFTRLSENCMDGGRCRLETSDPQDQALLELLSRREMTAP